MANPMLMYMHQVRAELHMRGVVFPPLYLVGGHWHTQGGYDGIETEGLCYVARSMGAKCYLAPRIVVRHSAD